MSRDIYIRSHEFHQFNLFEIGSCCVNCDKQMINKWKKEEDAFGADGSGGKVTCYLGENSKLGVFVVGKYGRRMRGNTSIHSMYICICIRKTSD